MDRASAEPRVEYGKRYSADGSVFYGARSEADGVNPYARTVVQAAPGEAAEDDFTVPVETLASYVSSTSLALWLKPSTAYVAQSFAWEDVSGQGNHFCAGRDRPAITNSWLDGNPGITFVGTSKQVLRCGRFAGIGKGDKPCALVVASINATHPTGTPTLLYLAGKTPLVATHLVFNATVGAVSGLVANVRHGSGGTVSQAGASAVGGYANGAPRLFMFVASNASDRAEVWEANTLRATAGAGAAGGLTVTPTHAVIGSGDEGGSATRWMDGTIGEIILFRNLPTSLELAALLDGYFATQWPTLYAGLA